MTVYVCACHRAFSFLTLLLLHQECECEIGAASLTAIGREAAPVTVRFDRIVGEAGA